MKKSILFMTLLAILGLNVACSDRVSDRDDIQREEAVDEIGHEMDEASDKIEDGTEEVVD